MGADRKPELDGAARALRDLFGADAVAELYEQVNNYGEGDQARTLSAALRLALCPACTRCNLPLSDRGWCHYCNSDPPPPYIAVDRETAYGHTVRSQRSVRVF